MKITALGVNSAFATGEYEQAVSTERVFDLCRRIKNTPAQASVSDDAMRAEIEQLSQRVYYPKWHSNFLIEFDMLGKRGIAPYRLLLDAGADVRHALKNVGLTALDLDGIYISHPHHDHIGGMEYLGLMTLLNPQYTEPKRQWLGEQFIAHKLFYEHHRWVYPPANAKPDLFIHPKVLNPLKRAIGPGLDTVQGVADVNIYTYFDVHLIGKQDCGNTNIHIFQDREGQWTMKPLFAMHVISSSEEMASYGISLEHSSGYTVLMPTDTQHMIPPQLQAHYHKAQRIYMDCETSQPPSGVHPHISELINQMAPEIQKKCLLYHYNASPETPEGMFYGILRAGDSHEYPE